MSCDHHHQHHHEGCCSSHSSCHKESCHAERDLEHLKCEFSKMLLLLADEAWTEVLKEKIKAHIEAAVGKHLDQLAKVVSDSNHERWKNKMANKKVFYDYEEKVADLFCGGQSCSSSKSCGS